MGNPSRPDLHPAIVDWACAYRKCADYDIKSVSSADLRNAFDGDLKQYFRLCALSRSTSAARNYVETAYEHVFRVRVGLEKAMLRAIKRCKQPIDAKISGALSNPFFGFSRKQGTSLRMPLTTCSPTPLCAGGCYAHDVLDATPGAVARGAMNGWIADHFEQGDAHTRGAILQLLAPHVRKAVRIALQELHTLPDGFKRRAYIRFSHVGEIVRFPDFSNALARLVGDLSEESVDCVVYTRHRDASRLDPKLWIINFTLDPSSKKSLSDIPGYARIVFSAFGGITSNIAEVNFLEHHRHEHIPIKGGLGQVCPATLPETKSRSCDACKCNRCFQKVETTKFA
jgi:hypothetical protein